MVVRGVVAAVLFACSAWVGVDEPKPTDVKQAVVGKWEALDKDKMALEINADGTIRVPSYKGGKWELLAGTYTIDAKGEIRYRVETGGIVLSGWYQYKDGALVTAMGPKNRVTFQRVEAKK